MNDGVKCRRLAQQKSKTAVFLHMIRKTVAIASLTIVLVAAACTADELPGPDGCEPGIATYERNIKAIIEASCAYSGCHDGGSPGVPGDYRTYQGMRLFLNSGTVRTRVIDLRDNPALGMPPNRSVYSQSRKDELTPEEFELMRCWLNNGFPER
jgi:hypothetical protein